MFGSLWRFRREITRGGERKRTWQKGHDAIVVIMDFAAVKVEPVAHDNCFEKG